MPNWCDNRLTVSGPADDVHAFRAGVLPSAEGVPQILRSHHPMPEELEQTTAPDYDASPEHLAYLIETYGADHWYDWANSAAGWGTKWSDSETVEVSYTPGQVVYTFDTPWAPPDAGLTHISRRFPTLTFTLEYVEIGMQFSGTTVFRDGVVVSSDARDDCGSDYAIERYGDLFEDDED